MGGGLKQVQGSALVQAEQLPLETRLEGIVLELKYQDSDGRGWPVTPCNSADSNLGSQNQIKYIISLSHVEASDFIIV